MRPLPFPNLLEIEDLLVQQERKSLLRFIVCGSVDHGKSTLIGRLLFEAGVLFADQIDALDRDSRRHGTQGEEPDFALLLDGLAAEREQKITIDVAYRFFATAKRKFIVADTPGHEQYTRNMATGASTADVALLLVSAREGLASQTKRHAVIVSTMGVRHLVVAVNKMDLVDWSQTAFAAVEGKFREFARDLGIEETLFIPVAAQSGDNIVARSERMSWYRGPTVLEHLERVKVRRPRRAAFRMPVQCVNRPNPSFRGYCGLIANGDVTPGTPVQILPSGVRTHVARIATADGDLARAVAGQAVTLCFLDDIDVSRGDVVAGVGSRASATQCFRARLVWLGQDALVPDRAYLLKLAAATVNATVEAKLDVLDLDTRKSTPTDCLRTNDIGAAFVRLDRPLAVDIYADIRETGSFILIDPDSFDTVGLGIVEAVHPAEDRGLAQETKLIGFMGATETRVRSVAKAISWRATGSLDTFILAALITGSSRVAGGVALAEVLTKTLIYYFHERVWAAISWGRR
jgi:sulfate adenylyltransferase large subunit